MPRNGTTQPAGTYTYSAIRRHDYIRSNFCLLGAATGLRWGGSMVAAPGARPRTNPGCNSLSRASPNLPACAGFAAHGPTLLSISPRRPHQQARGVGSASTAPDAGWRRSPRGGDTPGDARFLA